MKKLLLSLVALGGLAAMPATAQESGDAEQTTQRGAAPLSKDDFMRKHTERLRAADTDQDGVLSDEELQEMVRKRALEIRARRQAARLDVDGDGKVTLAEIERQREKQFTLLDTNDDGTLDAREMRRGARHMKKGRHGHHMGRVMRRGMGKPMRSLRDSAVDDDNG